FEGLRRSGCFLNVTLKVADFLDDIYFVLFVGIEATGTLSKPLTTNNRKKRKALVFKAIFCGVDVDEVAIFGGVGVEEAIFCGAGIDNSAIFGGGVFGFDGFLRVII
ncbi:hypothetical protein RhiirA1_483102, partial [Rhizophagus irregularis]